MSQVNGGQGRHFSQGWEALKRYAVNTLVERDDVQAYRFLFLPRKERRRKDERHVTAQIARKNRPAARCVPHNRFCCNNATADDQQAAFAGVHNEPGGFLINRIIARVPSSDRNHGQTLTAEFVE